jgi:polyhydroxyalkanoate synthesis regulator phasin
MASSERNFFQEGLYVGLGLAHRTKERIEEFAKKISDEYNMSEEEGRKFMDDLMKESEETQTRLDEIIEKRLETYLKDAGLPKKQDIDKLSKKIDELEKKLENK